MGLHFFIGCIEFHGVEVQHAVRFKLELDGTDLRVPILSQGGRVLQRKAVQRPDHYIQAVLIVQRLKKLQICHIPMLLFRDIRPD